MGVFARIPKIEKIMRKTLVPYKELDDRSYGTDYTLLLINKRLLRDALIISLLISIAVAVALDVLYKIGLLFPSCSLNR